MGKNSKKVSKSSPVEREREEKRLLFSGGARAHVREGELAHFRMRARNLITRSKNVDAGRAILFTGLYRASSSMQSDAQLQVSIWLTPHLGSVRVEEASTRFHKLNVGTDQLEVGAGASQSARFVRAVEGIGCRRLRDRRGSAVPAAVQLKREHAAR